VSEDVKAETPAAGARPQQFRRPPRFEVNGWINLESRSASLRPRRLRG
jgi:hypothetical protein